MALTFLRMLEDPSYASVVRWGDEGDSFVVLEVLMNSPMHWSKIDLIPEREIHEVHPPKAFQTQQFCELRETIEQIRLPQSAAKQ
jgi:hypothetical protein